MQDLDDLDERGQVEGFYRVEGSFLSQVLHVKVRIEGFHRGQGQVEGLHRGQVEGSFLFQALGSELHDHREVWVILQVQNFLQ